MFAQDKFSTESGQLSLTKDSDVDLMTSVDSWAGVRFSHGSGVWTALIKGEWGTTNEYKVGFGARDLQSLVLLFRFTSTRMGGCHHLVERMRSPFLQYRIDGVWGAAVSAPTSGPHSNHMLLLTDEALNGAPVIADVEDTASVPPDASATLQPCAAPVVADSTVSTTEAVGIDVPSNVAVVLEASEAAAPSETVGLETVLIAVAETGTVLAAVPSADESSKTAAAPAEFVAASDSLVIGFEGVSSSLVEPGSVVADNTAALAPVAEVNSTIADKSAVPATASAPEAVSIIDAPKAPSNTALGAVLAHESPATSVSLADALVAAAAPPLEVEPRMIATAASVPVPSAAPAADVAAPNLQPMQPPAAAPLAPVSARAPVAAPRTVEIVAPLKRGCCF